jgi:hypothetical protein
MINGLDITVFDNVFDKEQQIHMYNTGRTFPYYLANNDLPGNPGWEQKFMSELDNVLLKKFGFFELLSNNHPLTNLLKDRIMERAYINLGIPSDAHRLHDDMSEEGYMTLLYYMNPFWMMDWGGETIFLDSNGEIGYTSPFVSGRVLVFDSSILHAARVQTCESNAYRFTFAAKYSKKQNK